MISSRRRSRLVVTAALGACTIGTPAAHAQGATTSPQVIDQSNLCTVSFGIQDCSTEHLVLNTIVGPSGNTMFEVHGSFTETFTNTVTGAPISTSSGRIGLSELTTVDGLIRALADRTTSSLTEDGQTCTFAQVFVYANGSLRFDHIQSACT